MVWYIYIFHITVVIGFGFSQFSGAFKGRPQFHHDRTSSGGMVVMLVQRELLDILFGLVWADEMDESGGYQEAVRGSLRKILEGRTGCICGQTS